MIPASEIIFPALERIKVKDPDVPTITDSEAKTAIRELNDMMIGLADHDGIALGYTIIAKIDDPITTPDWTFGMMRAKLTLMLADEFGKIVTPSLVTKAMDYMKGVRRRTVRIRRPSLPDGLPTGQGNSAYGYNYGTASNFFYDEGSDDLRDDLGMTIDDENGNPLEDEPLNETP